MERKKALAAASAATLFLGSTIVAAASVSGASFLGFGGGSPHTSGSSANGGKPGVVVRTRNVYDRYVMDTGGGTDTGQASATGNTASASAPVSGLPDMFPSPTNATTPATGATPGGHHKPSRSPHSPTTNPPHQPSPTTVTPTTAPPVTVTTIPMTTTTLPRGVPADWPPGKPIPPMPPHCRQPQLELNGVWNCQSGD